MRISAFVASVASAAFVTFAAHPARADESHVESFVQRGLDGEAMRACDASLPGAAEGDDAQLACAQVYFRVYRLDDAERAALHALELLPTDAAPLELLALVYATRGDDVQARRYAERAVALRPGDEAAGHLLAAIDVRDRLRAAGVAPGPAAGTPARVVWDLVQAGRAGHLADGIRAAVDADLRPRAQAYAEEIERRYGSLVGFAFDPDAPGGTSAPDAVQVVLRIAAQERPDVARAASIARRLDRAAAAAETELPPPEIATYRSLGAPERLAYVRRRANLATPRVLTLAFQLRRRGEAWQIVDFSSNGVPLATLERDGDSQAPELIRGHPTPLTTICAVGAGVAFVLWALLRRRRGSGLG